MIHDTFDAVYGGEFVGSCPPGIIPIRSTKAAKRCVPTVQAVVAWLDNDRVIFTRLKQGEPFLQMKFYTDGVYNGETVIWDTKTDQIIPYHDRILWCIYG